MQSVYICSLIDSVESIVCGERGVKSRYTMHLGETETNSQLPTLCFQPCYQLLQTIIHFPHLLAKPISKHVVP